MDAQFSTAYLVATALRTGEVSFASYTPAALSDPATGSLAERVSTICDLPVDGDRALAPIELRIGDQRERIDDVLGSIERPMQEQDQRAKLTQCIGHARGEGMEAGDGDAAWRRLRAAVGALGDAGSTVELLDVMDGLWRPQEGNRWA
jgi:2-methylcitrate dehydratase PrpD